MKQGALIFDETADRYDIRFDLAELCICMRFGFTKNLVLPEPEPPITRIFLFLAFKESSLLRRWWLLITV